MCSLYTQAVEESERALAVVQSRLLEALRVRADLQAEVSAVRREADQERARLEAAVGDLELVHS